jgi:large subunit ribosomal protein L11
MALIKLMVDGGDMKPGPAIAQQLGPMGINIGKVLSDINSATKDFKGMQVPVHLDVDGKTKTYNIKVLSPTVSALLKKETGLESGSGARKKNIVGNISMEQIIGIAKTKHSSMLAKEFLAAVKSTIGSCMSMGLLIDNKDPKEIIEDIKEGKYDKEIKSQKTELSAEKKKDLSEFFNKIKGQQEAAKKKEEEEKAAAEALKAAAATAAPVAGATPVAGTAPVAGATPTAAGAKPAAKPAAAKK